MLVKISLRNNNKIRIDLQEHCSEQSERSKYNKNHSDSRAAREKEQTAWLGLSLNARRNIRTASLYFNEGLDAACAFQDDLMSRRHIVESAIVSASPSSLDILTDSQRASKHASYGQNQSYKQLTKKARSGILEAGQAVSNLVPDASGQFMLTLTLPGSLSEGMDCLSRYSGYIVNRQLQYIRRKVKKSGVPIHWFFVWELQARGALHQHWCIASEDKSLAEEISLEVKDIWYQLLIEIGDANGIDLFAKHSKFTHRNLPENWQWNLQIIEKSVAAYFAKYASKGSAEIVEKYKNSSRQSVCPSRWTGSSKSVKEEIKKWTFEYTTTELCPIDAKIFYEKLRARIPFSSAVIHVEGSYEILNQDNGKTYCSGSYESGYFSRSDFEYLSRDIRGYYGTAESRANQDTEYSSDLWASRRLGSIAESDIRYVTV